MGVFPTEYWYLEGNESTLPPHADPGGPWLMAGNTSSSSNPSPGPHVRKASMSMGMAEAVMFAALMSVCICVTIIGNVLVIMSVFTYRPLKNVPNFFIVSLAVADLAVAILVMPFNVANFIIGHWVFGVIFCNMWLTFDILTCTASILNLCAIALDRFYAIHDPINYAAKRTSKRVLVGIAIVWGASAVISIPPLVGWNNSSGTGLYDQRTGVCTLTDEKGYVIYSASGSFYVPLFIMTFVYVNIFRATRRRLRARAKAAAAAKLAAVGGKKPGEPAPVQEQDPENSSTEESPEDTPEVVASCGPQTNNQHDMYTSTRTEKETADPRVPLTSASDKNENVQVHQFLEQKHKISLSKERRAARTMAIIMGVFVLCWLPFFLMYVIFPFCVSCRQTDPRVVNFIVWLGYINSSLNPIIYTIFNIDFRRAFKKLLQGKCRL